MVSYKLQQLLLSAQSSLHDLQEKVTALEARLTHRETQIQQLQIALIKLRKLQFGKKSEKLSRDIEQLELRLEDLDTTKALERPISDTAPSTKKRKAKRKPLPDHLPRETARLESPCACPGCGGDLHSLGVDSSETLEYVPGRFKVIREEREKLACQGCETVVHASPRSKAIPKGNAGPGLLAHVLVSKYADYLPLY